MSYNWVGDNIYIYGAEQKPETYLQGYGAMIPLKMPQTFSVFVSDDTATIYLWTANSN